MSYYKYARGQYEQPKENLEEVWKQRLIKWRDQGAIVEAENPTRIPKAREQGYKAKNGFTIARTRITKGSTKRKRSSGGRRPKTAGQNRYSSKKSKRVIAEQRASKKYTNLEVLNSYWVAEDGNHKWYEIIMVDPEHPEIEADEELNWLCKEENRKRAERGLTTAAKKSRGQKNKGTGAEKVRPSVNSEDGKGK